MFILHFVLFLHLNPWILPSCFSHQQLELEPGIATQDPCLVFSFLLRREMAIFILGIGKSAVELCQPSSLNSVTLSSSSPPHLAVSLV